MTGLDVERRLETIGITANKNAIPNDPLPTGVTSGIRLGTAAMTTRGFTAAESRRIGQIIAETVFADEGDVKLHAFAAEIDDMLYAHPLYPELGQHIYS